MFLFALQNKILIIQIQFWMPVSCSYPPFLLLCSGLQFPTHPVINPACLLLNVINYKRRAPVWHLTEMSMTSCDPWSLWPRYNQLFPSPLCENRLIYSAKTGKQQISSHSLPSIPQIWHCSVQVQAVWLLDKHTHVQRRLNWNLSL